MLPLEIIGVLGALFGLLVYGMVSTHLAKKRTVRARRQAGERASAPPENVR